MLSTRLTAAVKGTTKEQDVVFPEKPEFRNDLRAIRDAGASVQYNFELFDGQTSDLQSDSQLLTLAVSQRVSLIRLWFDPNMALLRGLQLYAKDKLLLQTGCPFEKYKCLETKLQEGERILGLRARRQNESAGYLLDF